MAGYERDFNRDSGGLNLTPGQQSAWELFKVQLDRAGAQIEKTFITELTPLTGPLGELSAAFSDLVRSLLGGEQGKSLIHGMAEGIREFAGYINSPDFKTGVKEFVEDIGKLAHVIHEALHLIVGDNDKPFPTGPDRLKEYGIDPKKLGQPGWPSEVWDWLKGLNPLGWSGNAAAGASAIPISYRTAIAGSGAFSDIEAANGLPGGLLASVRRAESGGNDSAVSSAGAQGPFQFMPGTFARYGQGSPFRLADASQAAGRYLGKLLAEFHGDVAKALAGYNWGEGNVENDVARWGAAWRAHLPKETQGYLNKVLPGVGIDPRPGQRYQINVFNHTGGNAIVTAAAMTA